MVCKVTWGDIDHRREIPQACIDEQCEYNDECKDASGTGDSPSSFECTCMKPEDCPLHNAVMLEIEEELAED